MEMLSDKFICATHEYCEINRFVNAPLIRKSFILEKALKKAELYICGLGFYRLFLNGKDITRGKLCPYISNPDHIIYYDKYDISALLQVGNNAIGVVLGNGMQNAMGGTPWDFDKARWRSSPKLALSVITENGVLFETDDTFKWKKSPILFDDLRLGEHYDARLYINGWSKPDYDDNDWNNCFAAKKPLGEKKINCLPPIVKLRELSAKRIIKVIGGYVYDFGYNSAGVCRLKIKGKRGQKITLTHGEIFEDGKIDIENICTPKTYKTLFQKDVYICSGDGEEVYEPSFTYHGFQYVFVEGVSEEQATLPLLTYLIFSSEMQEQTSFCCSDQTINKLQEMVKNATRSNFYYFPTDCPHREKNGWTGDIAVSVEHMLLNYDNAAYFKEWLCNVRKAQLKSGAIPCVVPTADWGYGWGSGPAWDCALTYVPYFVYKYTGDEDILKENADAIYRYILFLRSKKQGEFIEFGLGDWCEIEGFTPSTAVFVTDTLISYDICRKACFIFELLGLKSYKKVANALKEEIYSDFHRVMITPKGLCRCETQTCYALLIAFDFLNDTEKENAVKRLVMLIERNDCKMKFGILGARYIFHILSRYGYSDLAYKMIVRESYPGYGEWVKKGSTSLWETFFETEEKTFKTVTGQKMDSLNHHFFGDISHWFLENIAGIFVNEKLIDSNEIKIKPCEISALTFAEGEYRRNGNYVFVKWKREYDKTKIEVETEGEFKVKCLFDGYLITEENKTIKGTRTDMSFVLTKTHL